MIFKFSKNNVYKLVDYEGFAKGFLSNELANKIVERGGTIYPIRVNDNGDIFGIIYGDGQTEWDEIIFDKDKKYFEPLNEDTKNKGTTVSFVGLRTPKNRSALSDVGKIGYYRRKALISNAARPNSNSTWPMPIDFPKFSQMSARMPEHSTSFISNQTPASVLPIR